MHFLYLQFSMITFGKLKAKLKLSALRKNFISVRRRFKRLMAQPRKISMDRKNSNSVMNWTNNPSYKTIKSIHMSPSASTSCESIAGYMIADSDKQGEPIYSNDYTAVIPAPSATSLEYPETISESRDMSLNSFSSFRPSAASSPYGSESTMSSRDKVYMPRKSLTTNMDEPLITHSVNSFNSVSSSGLGSPFLSQCMLDQESKAFQNRSRIIYHQTKYRYPENVKVTHF